MNENIIEKLRAVDLNNLSEEYRQLIAQELKTIDVNSLEPELKEKANWILGLANQVQMPESPSMQPIEISVDPTMDANSAVENPVTPPETPEEAISEPIAIEPSMEAVNIQEQPSDIQPEISENETAAEPVVAEPVVETQPEVIIDSSTDITANSEIPLEPISNEEIVEPTEPVSSLDEVEPVTITSTSSPIEETIQSDTNMTTNPTIESTPEPVMEEKPKKKSNPVLVVILLVVIAALGVLFYLIYTKTIDISTLFKGNNNQTSENETSDTNTSSTTENENISSTEEEKEDEKPNESEQTVETTYYELGKEISAKNSVFSYILKLTYEEEFNSMGIEIKLTNNTDSIQMANVRLKFYDKDKKILGTYQWRGDPEVNESSSFAIKAGMSSSYSLSLSDDKLDNNNSFKNVVYFTVEELEF